MKIEFSKEQYLDLMKLVYLGNYVVNTAMGNEEDIENFNKIEDFIFSKAKDAGLERFVEDIEEDNEKTIYASEELEGEVEEIIEAFEENIFWQDLVDLLTKRDVESKYSEDELAAMDMEKIMDIESEIFEKYADEFDKNGINNLFLKK